jgi:GNAT superfamily N-acetyltransferase
MQISLETPPAKEDLAILREGLKDHRLTAVGEAWIKDLAYFLRDEAGTVRGGVFGNCGSFGWLYVDTLWVDESLRGQGYGARLMAAIETEARRRSCSHVYLSTFTFQAGEFYKHLGYTEFGRLDDFPPGHSRLFLRKDLT